MNLRLIAGLFILFYCICLSYGQTDPLDDFWKDVERRKGMKKKEFKDEAIKFKSKILSSYGNSIFIVQQDYIYEKKNIRYVKDDDEYYDRIYGVGVATDIGLLTSKHLFQPWRNNNSLLPSKGYSPILTTVKIKSYSDTVVVTKEEGKYTVSAMSSLALYPFYKDDGIGNRIVKPDSAGLLMLFYHASQEDTFTTKIIEYKAKWKEGVAEIDTQLMSKQLIGGLFFNVDTTQGSSVIVITALISGDEENDFKLIGLSDHMSIKSSDKSKGEPEPKRISAREQKSKSSEKAKMQGKSSLEENKSE